MGVTGQRNRSYPPKKFIICFRCGSPTLSWPLRVGILRTYTEPFPDLCVSNLFIEYRMAGHADRKGLAMFSRLVLALAVIGLTAGCSNTIRGVGQDTAN